MKKEKTIKELNNELDKILTSLEQSEDVEKIYTGIEKGVNILGQLQQKVSSIENKFIELKNKIGDN